MYRSILVLTLLAPLVWADPGSIWGVVSDPNGRPAPGIRVEVQPGGRVAQSGPAGEFTFDGVTPGQYTVNAESRHFETVTVEGIRVVAGEQVRVDVPLRNLRVNHVQIDVIGSDHEVALREIPGSAYLISRETLASSRAIDANEVLRQAPGLHIREDSGPVGMRLNIGIRGLNPDRSRTLLVLEDGLPVSLAPYGEPEMYYSPPIDRMSRVEILKGSGSIVHGPQTIGGVLNFITPDPPAHPQGTLELTGGQYGFFSGQASYGGTRDNIGWYINALRKQGDGWRDFFFDINDVTSKLNVAISETHRLGLKIGFYDERSNSTYLGLTDLQFRTNPAFNAVPDDFLKIRRYSGSVLHQAVLSPRALLSTSLFGYTTSRNWRRQDFDRVARAGVAYRSVAGDPSVPGDAIYLRNSTGNNNREFDVAGAETRLGLEHETLGLRQRLEAGVRYLYEQHRDRRIDGSGYMALSGVIREDEVRNGGAASGFVQNRILVGGKLSITPGLRLERYAFDRNILRQPVNGTPADVSIRKGDSVLKPIPGIGAAWQAAAPLTLFAGVHRGFAPPRVKDAITRAGVSLELDAELSWNYEVGARLESGRGVRAGATLFTTDFENQIIPAAQSGGATTSLINGGETLHRGAEFELAADWDRITGSRAGIITEVRYTWLPDARFTSGIYRGNRLPYAPEHLFTVRTGYRRRGFSVHLDGTRAGSQFGDNLQTVAGSPDGTVGLLPAYWVWNISGGHEFRRERFTVEPFVAVKNLADEVYISSRAPLGIQPGMFRQVNGGVKFRF